MDISESGQLYLRNYYILEQTRKEANQYLEEIANKFSSRVEERIKEINHPLVGFRKYVQKGGGNVDFIAEYKNDVKVPELEYLGDLKFSINYSDAMRNESLSSPTQYRINGVSPKSSAKLISELKRVSNHLNFLDPYSATFGELLDMSFEDIVNQIVKSFIDRQDHIIQILEFLFKENQNKKIVDS